MKYMSPRPSQTKVFVAGLTQFVLEFVPQLLSNHEMSSSIHVKQCAQGHYELSPENKFQKDRLNLEYTKLRLRDHLRQHSEELFQDDFASSTKKVCSTVRHALQRSAAVEQLEYDHFQVEFLVESCINSHNTGPKSSYIFSAIMNARH